LQISSGWALYSAFRAQALRLRFLLASAWYPPEYQGLAMGIAGAGNSGTLMASLFAPRLAQVFGWRDVFAFAGIPLLIVWAVFFVLAKEAPVARSVKTWKDYVSVLKIPDSAWFCFLYSLTFGSFLRPVGGVLSDKLGGYRMLLVLFAIAVVLLGLLATLPATAVAVALFALLMAMLGMGNGSVFQLVPQRFPDDVGIITGLVGAAGGWGGFMLPSLMGLLKDGTGTFAAGFAVTAVLFSFGLSVLLWLKKAWRQTWPNCAAERAGLLKAEPLTAPAYATE
jgi:NNP family nitrate/nitrite transporter-like MFS transporter